MTLRSRCFPLNGNAVDVTLWSHAHSFGMNAIGVLGNWDAKTLLAISKTSMDQMIPHGDTERLWKLINDVIDLEKIRLKTLKVSIEASAKASMKDDPSAPETPSVKHVSSEELPSLEHDSFKEKLLRRQRARGESACEICLIDAPLDAVHLFDSSNREALEKLYYRDNHNFPVCTNDSTNGILLCGPCHSAFVSQDGLLQIDIDGDIIAKKGCGPASDRNGMKIAWSDRIGKNGYPSAVFLATVFAMQSSSAFLFKKRGLGVEIQGQDDEEGEGEGEEVK